MAIEKTGVIQRKWGKVKEHVCPHQISIFEPGTNLDLAKVNNIKKHAATTKNCSTYLSWIYKDAGQWASPSDLAASSSNCQQSDLSAKSIKKHQKNPWEKKKKKVNDFPFWGGGGSPIWWDTLAPDVGRLRHHKRTAEDQSTFLEPTGGSLVFLK